MRVSMHCFQVKGLDIINGRARNDVAMFVRASSEVWPPLTTLDVRPTTATTMAPTRPSAQTAHIEGQDKKGVAHLSI
jgi:hypothetical protein